MGREHLWRRGHGRREDHCLVQVVQPSNRARSAAMAARYGDETPPAEFKVAFALHLGADLPHRLEPSRRQRAGHLCGVMFVASASGQLGNECLKLFAGHSQPSFFVIGCVQSQYRLEGSAALPGGRGEPRPGRARRRPEKVANQASSRSKPAASINSISRGGAPSLVIWMDTLPSLRRYKSGAYSDMSSHIQAKIVSFPSGKSGRSVPLSSPLTSHASV